MFTCLLQQSEVNVGEHRLHQQLVVAASGVSLVGKLLGNSTTPGLAGGYTILTRQHAHHGH